MQIGQSGVGTSVAEVAGSFIGIDVAQQTLEIAIRPRGERWQTANSSDGIAELVRRLSGLAPTLVVLEATGGLEVPLLAALGAAGLAAVAVNPRQVREFARATGKLAKTDALDAQVLAHFAEAVRPPVRPVPAAATQALAALVTRRRQLIERLVAEESRRSSAPAAVREDIQEHLAWLRERLHGVDQDLGRAMRSSPLWRRAG
jgi:transposase